jgi:hypothetical protein
MTAKLKYTNIQRAVSVVWVGEVSVTVHIVVPRATNGHTCRVDRLHTHYGRLAY